MNHATGNLYEIAAILDRSRPLDECAGEGKCHGCLSWCRSCGSVNRVCDDARNCDTHRPSDCCGQPQRLCECVYDANLGVLIPASGAP